MNSASAGFDSSTSDPLSLSKYDYLEGQRPIQVPGLFQSMNPVDVKIEQSQEKIGISQGFLEERALVLSREKEQHFENIISRIAPGAIDPGCKVL